MTGPADGGIPPTPENSQSQSEALNPFAALVGVVMSPGETFAQIAAAPRSKVPLWLGPLLLFVALSIVTTLLVMPKFDFESSVRDQLAKQGSEVDEAQIDMVIAIQKPLIYTTAVVGTPFVLLIIAGVYLLGFKAFGGEGTFGKFFTVAVLAWTPQVVKSIIGAIVMVTRESVSIEEAQTIVMSNLGFLAEPTSSPALFALLSSLDVFTFWSLALLFIGYELISRLSRTTSIGVVAGVWVVYVLGKTGFALLGQMMNPGAGA